MKAWLVHHGRSASLAWRRLTATPVNSLLSLLAIGIALALPAGGQMLLSGIRDLAGNSTATPRISVFMNIAAERAVADNIRSRLERHAGVRQAGFLPREETLARMKSSPGLRDVIDALAANPFQLDSAWVRRLDALLKLGRTALMLFAGLLGGGLIAITFGIIRMQVLTQRAEIEVSRLLGATEAFIRRPFLYHGLLLGVGGSVMAWLLVIGTTLWLRAPLAELAGLYDLNLALHPLSASDSALLLACAGCLGWLGALFSLRQNLGQG